MFEIEQVSMRKYLLPIVFSSFILSLGLFFYSFSQIETKAKTKLKLALENFLIDFERKTNLLDQLGQKTALRQLTRQGAKSPMLVDHLDQHWHILQQIDQNKIEVGYFSNQLQKITLPAWSRIEDSANLKPLYFRLIPSKEGRHRVFQIKNFEKTFFSAHERLAFSFTSDRDKKSPFLFFEPFESLDTFRSDFSFFGRTIKMEKLLDGIKEPLCIQFRFPLPLTTLVFGFLSLIFFFMFIYEIVFYILSAKHRLSAILLSISFVLATSSIYIQKTKKSTFETQIKNQNHAKNYAETGVRNYFLHIEQMAKSLLSIYEENPIHLDASLFKKWGYLQKIRLIDHEKNYILEKAQEGFEKSKSLSTFFMKDSGWIGSEFKTSQPGIVYFTTVNEKTIYLQLSLQPIIDPLSLLLEETGQFYELKRYETKDLSSISEKLLTPSAPFYLDTQPINPFNPIPWIVFFAFNFVIFLICTFQIISGRSLLKNYIIKDRDQGVNFTKRGMIR